MATTYYSNLSSLQIGGYLYYDACLTSPVANGYYSNGPDSFYVAEDTGHIIGISSCPSWDFYYAKQHSCTSCTSGFAEYVVRFDAGTSVSIGKFFPFDSDYCYLITSFKGTSTLYGVEPLLSPGGFINGCGPGSACFA